MVQASWVKICVVEKDTVALLVKLAAWSLILSAAISSLGANEVAYPRAHTCIVTPMDKHTRQVQNSSSTSL
jgi:hypothetical protein